MSVGIFDGEVVLDLDYQEDSAAETDMNLVMTEAGGFIEIQGTAEDGSFSAEQLNTMLDYGRRGLLELFDIQRAALDAPLER